MFVCDFQMSFGRQFSVCSGLPSCVCAQEAGGFQDVMFAASKLSELELDKDFLGLATSPS